MKNAKCTLNKLNLLRNTVTLLYAISIYAVVRLHITCLHFWQGLLFSGITVCPVLDTYWLQRLRAQPKLTSLVQFNRSVTLWAQLIVWGEWRLSLNWQIKLLHLKPSLICGERGIFDMFQTLVGILGETEAGPILSQLVRDHLVALSNEFERYFPSSKDGK